MKLHRAITVAELVRLLDGVPQDATVVLEGCDCTSECAGISLTDIGNSVYLIRTDSADESLIAPAEARQ